MDRDIATVTVARLKKGLSRIKREVASKVSDEPVSRMKKAEVGRRLGTLGYHPNETGTVLKKSAVLKDHKIRLPRNVSL